MNPISAAKAAQVRSQIQTMLIARLGHIPDLGEHFNRAFAAMTPEDWEMVTVGVLLAIESTGCAIVTAAPDAKGAGDG